VEPESHPAFGVYLTNKARRAYLLTGRRRHRHRAGAIIIARPEIAARD
jgi:hypothetical protein